MRDFGLTLAAMRVSRLVGVACDDLIANATPSGRPHDSVLSHICSDLLGGGLLVLSRQEVSPPFTNLDCD